MPISAQATRPATEQPAHTPYGAGPYKAEKRAEYRYAVLAPNRDAGKDGVSYSGAYLTLCTTDGPDEAALIARAMNELAAREPGLAVL